VLNFRFRETKKPRTSDEVEIQSESHPLREKAAIDEFGGLRSYDPQREAAVAVAVAEDEARHPDLKPEQMELINKMVSGLTAAILAMDHLLGPNWFRADPDHVAAIEACLNGLDAYQMLLTAGISPPPQRVLNFITQRVKLDGYLRDGITDICGCAEVIEEGGQLCHFHRQHYFAYRQKADPKTMLQVQHWAQKRRCSVSVWKTKGGVL
jgi:hypothetical protein